MLNWIVRGLVIVGVAYVGYGTWEYYRGGFFSRPDLPKGAFSLSYKNGLRAILVDVPDRREQRRYFGHSLDVPHYLRDAWSTCTPPTKAEAANAVKFIADRNLPGERFEAVCRLQADSDTVVRGLVTSVPRL